MLPVFIFIFPYLFENAFTYYSASGCNGLLCSATRIPSYY